MDNGYSLEITPDLLETIQFLTYHKKIQLQWYPSHSPSQKLRVSVQGVESLWGDCRFIPADWGSQ